MQNNHVINLYMNPAIMKHLTMARSLQRLLKQKMYSHYQLHVIDIVKEADRTHEDRIFMIPTLVRKSPAPEQRIIGDLSDMQNVINILES
jgi:circadian clock protein KaiB